MPVEIFVKVINCKDKAGKAFKAYETTDKSGNRVNVRFTLECEPIKDSCYIQLLNYWQDKRKTYPTIRVADYKVIDKPIIKSSSCDIEF